MSAISCVYRSNGIKVVAIDVPLLRSHLYSQISHQYRVQIGRRKRASLLHFNSRMNEL